MENYRDTRTVALRWSHIFVDFFFTLVLGLVNKKNCQKGNYHYIYCVCERTNGKKIYDRPPKTLIIQFYTCDELNCFFFPYTDRVPSYTQDTDEPPIANTTNCNYRMQSLQSYVIVSVGCILELSIAAERIRPQNVCDAYMGHTLLFWLGLIRA